MIFARARILLVEDSPSELEAFRKLLSHEGRFQLETARNGKEGLRLARLNRPDLIISDYNMPGMNGFEFCRHVKDDPRTSGTMFVVITGFQDTQLKVEGLNLGIDDYLTKPVEAAELFAKVRAMLRLKSLHDELRTERDELEKVHSNLGVSYAQLQGLLLHMIDLSLPGAAARGERLAQTAVKLAEALEVPSRFLGDLTAAALLHECGKVVQTEDDWQLDPGYIGESVSNDWRYVLLSNAILNRVDRLQEAADLILGMFENWDGSGFPEHRRQGQIPLRSRILRISIDFFQDLRRARHAGQPVDPIAAVEDLARRSGTLYDPLVVEKLRQVIEGTGETEWLEASFRIPVPRISHGMVLAEDLCTNSGVKLLARGATVTDSLLSVILKRHACEPIVKGALISY